MWDPPLGPSVLTSTPPCVHPLRDSASSLAHHLVSGSNTNYNGLSPLSADIVLFGFSPKVFKTRLLRSGFHTLIKNVSSSSPIDVGSHNPPPFGAQRPLLVHCLVSTPLRDSTSSLAHRLVSGSNTNCSGPNPPLANIVFSKLFLSGFPSRFLKHVF